MFNFYKMLFLLTLILGTLITVSSNSWFGMWMGLEINLLSIIPLMNNGTNPRSSEASLKYFITQAMASMILMISILMIQSTSWTFSNLSLKNLPSMMALMSLATKMGAAPFHFWLPEVMEGLTWMNSLILLTWQKIAPFSIMFFINKPYQLMVNLIIFSMVVSGILGMNQTSLRKIMAYSSINHMGWMLATTFSNEKVWIWYFLIYSSMNLVIVMFFHWINAFHLNQLENLFQIKPTTKILFMMNFVSLGGIPPFIGFLPKWMVIQMLTQNNLIFLNYFMIISTLITIYYYLRISIPSLTFSFSSNISIVKDNLLPNKNWFLINSFLLTSLITLTFSFNWM